MRLLALTLLVWTLSTPLTFAQPSFDCSLASQVAEKVICGSKELSQLDQKITQRYLDTLESAQDDITSLRQTQRQWLMERNKCEYGFDCILQQSLQRLRELNSSYSEPFSWGGVLRQSPGLDAARVGSTYERQPITVLAQQSEYWNGYPWFKVVANGMQAYQWGGIICDPSMPDKTYCEE